MRLIVPQIDRAHSQLSETPLLVLIRPLEVEKSGNNMKIRTSCVLYNRGGMDVKASKHLLWPLIYCRMSRRDRGLSNNTKFIPIRLGKRVESWRLVVEIDLSCGKEDVLDIYYYLPAPLSPSNYCLV